MSKNRLSYQAKLSRHSHDVSAGYTASLAPGVIVPQYFDIAGPGDAYYYNTRMFARLQDLVTAFLGEIDVHVDYFFVPLQMIYTPFGQIFSQTDDVLTSLYKDLGATDKFPVLDVIRSIPLNPEVNKFAGHRDVVAKEIFRLLDALNANPLCVLHPDPESDLYGYRDQPKVSPWLFAAYQAIYQKFFRNDELEKFQVQDYNIDQYYQAANFTNERLLRLRYCQRPVDYFTSMRVSPIASAINRLGAVSSSQTGTNPGDSELAGLLSKVDDWLGFASNDYAYQNRFTEDNEYPGNGNLAQDFNSSPHSFEATTIGHDLTWTPTAANIRTLFAVDKFLRVYGRSDKTYDDQILAHFGIKIPHDVKHDITHLKHYHFVLQSDPIYGTANVQNTEDSQELVSNLGQVGGQCSGAVDTMNGDPEKFVAPVHGVFMAVAYVVTKPRYFGTYSRLHELDQRLKFPIPEFDKLGAEPLFVHEFNPHYFQVRSGEDVENGIEVRAGWVDRYSAFKHKFNRCSYIYADVNSIIGYDTHPLADRENVFAPYVLARSPFLLRTGEFMQSNFLDAWQFFEMPDALDGIMASSYVGDWNQSWDENPQLVLQSDPILTEFFARVKKVSWMSETGEPDL